MERAYHTRNKAQSASVASSIVTDRRSNLQTDCIPKPHLCRWHTRWSTIIVTSHPLLQTAQLMTRAQPMLSKLLAIRACVGRSTAWAPSSVRRDKCVRNLDARTPRIIRAHQQKQRSETAVFDCKENRQYSGLAAAHETQAGDTNAEERQGGGLGNGGYHKVA